MNSHVHAIANRLSLRAPQRESLDILARLCEIVPLQKERDLAQVMATVRSEFPSVEEFEREFPSLCFALATGVGKTRLMGAFIAYLHRAERIRHFFVLAPNLTIYDKLIRDFTPNTPKYVFHGLSDLTINPPEIITGDNYESGRGVRAERRIQSRFEFDPTQAIHINIFNISKINAEVKGGNTPRIKRLAEYIGESYFEYLAGLDDLVLLMDESHRYRASAGVKAINELKPILGLELTATPQVETGGKAIPFRNVIYSYPLSAAMNDGFVKEPAVVTRENFDATQFDVEGLERVKLEDGVRLHEYTKGELVVYANENGRAKVKPFMLVVAQDIEHAARIRQLMESDAFFEGAYRGKVIEIHSKQGSEEKDENVARLLSVEDPTNPVEVVVHVNMLKEGWDVTNLYTIVPLRAANSKTLVEQSVGRGLRLPYGRRTGNAAVDRLNIISHDRFQEIIDEARKPESIIRTGIIIGKDVPASRSFVAEVRPVLLQELSTGKQESLEGVAEKVLFATPEERAVATKTLEIIQRSFGNLPSLKRLSTPEMTARLVQAVEAESLPIQASLGIGQAPVSVAATVGKVLDRFRHLYIGIPRIVFVPKGEQSGRFRQFVLGLERLRPQPVDDKILLQYLRTEERDTLERGGSISDEARLEDFIVRGLIDFDDVSYDAHADILYDLAGQVVKHVASYITDEEGQRNVLRYHQKALVSEVHEQMLQHFDESATEYEVEVTRGFVELPTSTFSSTESSPRDFRQVPENKSMIRQLTFGGFEKCYYPVTKFDSDPERRFSVILEKDSKVEKWLRPSKGVLRIYYRQEEEYIPDFVVEDEERKYLCEIKDEDSIADPEVEAKAQAAILWCRRATDHAGLHGDKGWFYLLIPGQAVTENRNIEGLAKLYARHG